MTVSERILEILHALPPEQQAEVLDFAEFLQLRLKPAQQPAADLKPLPLLAGRVPPGWKDAIYDHHSSGGLAMRSLHIRVYVDKQGQVTFRMPKEFADQDVDLVVVYEPIKSAEGLGWPSGFFEEVAGSIPDFPEIDSEGEFEVRDPLP